MTGAFIARLLTAYPPQIVEKGTEDIGRIADRVPPRAIRQIKDLVFNVMISMASMGTGLIHVIPAALGAEARSVDPRYWFPAGGSSSTYIDVKEDTAHIYQYIWNEVHFTIYERDGDILGDPAASEPMIYQLGDLARFDYLASLTDANYLPLYNIPHQPSSGTWGRSIFQDITSLAFEINNQMATNSRVIIANKMAKLLMMPKEEASLDELYDDKGADRMRVISKLLDKWYGQEVLELPAQYTDAKFLEWNGQVENAFTQIEKAQEFLFSATNIAADLYGLGTGKPVSGRSLRYQYLRTWIYLLSQQNNITPYLKDVIMHLAMYEGASLAELTELNDMIEIIMKNVFDELDNVSEVVVGEEGAETEE